MINQKPTQVVISTYKMTKINALSYIKYACLVLKLKGKLKEKANELVEIIPPVSVFMNTLDHPILTQRGR